MHIKGGPRHFVSTSFELQKQKSVSVEPVSANSWYLCFLLIYEHIRFV